MHPVKAFAPFAVVEIAAVAETAVGAEAETVVGVEVEIAVAAAAAEAETADSSVAGLALDEREVGLEGVVGPHH